MADPLMILKQKIIKTDAVLKLLAEKKNEISLLQTKLTTLNEKYITKQNENKLLENMLCDYKIRLQNVIIQLAEIPELKVQHENLKNKYNNDISVLQMKYQSVSLELEKIKETNCNNKNSTKESPNKSNKLKIKEQSKTILKLQNKVKDLKEKLNEQKISNKSNWKQELSEITKHERILEHYKSTEAESFEKVKSLEEENEQLKNKLMELELKNNFLQENQFALNDSSIKQDFTNLDDQGSKSLEVIDDFPDTDFNLSLNDTTPAEFSDENDRFDNFNDTKLNSDNDNFKVPLNDNNTNNLIIDAFDDNNSKISFNNISVNENLSNNSSSISATSCNQNKIEEITKKHECEIKQLCEKIKKLEKIEIQVADFIKQQKDADEIKKQHQANIKDDDNYSICSEFVKNILKNESKSADLINDINSEIENENDDYINKILSQMKVIPELVLPLKTMERNLNKIKIIPKYDLTYHSSTTSNYRKKQRYARKRNRVKNKFQNQTANSESESTNCSPKKRIKTNSLHVSFSSDYISDSESCAPNSSSESNYDVEIKSNNFNYIQPVKKILDNVIKTDDSGCIISDSSDSIESKYFNQALKNHNIEQSSIITVTCPAKLIDNKEVCSDKNEMNHIKSEFLDKNPMYIEQLEKKSINDRTRKILDFIKKKGQLTVINVNNLVAPSTENKEELREIAVSWNVYSKTSKSNVTNSELDNHNTNVLIVENETNATNNYEFQQNKFESDSLNAIEFSALCDADLQDVPVMIKSNNADSCKCSDSFDSPTLLSPLPASSMSPVNSSKNENKHLTKEYEFLGYHFEDRSNSLNDLKIVLISNENDNGNNLQSPNKQNTIVELSPVDNRNIDKKPLTNEELEEVTKSFVSNPIYTGQTCNKDKQANYDSCNCENSNIIIDLLPNKCIQIMCPVSLTNDKNQKVNCKSENKNEDDVQLHNIEFNNVLSPSNKHVNLDEISHEKLHELYDSPLSPEIELCNSNVAFNIEHTPIIVNDLKEGTTTLNNKSPNYHDITKEDLFGTDSDSEEETQIPIKSGKTFSNKTVNKIKNALRKRNGSVYNCSSNFLLNKRNLSEKNQKIHKICNKGVIKSKKKPIKEIHIDKNLLEIDSVNKKQKSFKKPVCSTRDKLTNMKIENVEVTKIEEANLVTEISSTDENQKRTFKKPICTKRKKATGCLLSSLPAKCSLENNEYLTTLPVNNIIESNFQSNISENNVDLGDNINIFETTKNSSIIIDKVSCKNNSVSQLSTSSDNSIITPTCESEILEMTKICPMKNVKPISASTAICLLKQLLNYPTDEENVKNVCKKFHNQKAEFIARNVLRIVAANFNETPDRKYTPPAPIMTPTQRVLQGFMNRMEKLGVNNVLINYMKITELYLLNKVTLQEIDPISRLYVAVCKQLKQIERIRLFLSRAIYKMDLFVPLLHTILTNWLEILPLEHDSVDEPLVRVIVQIILSKPITKVDVNLGNIKTLLNIYYGYPKEKWHEHEFFENILSKFKDNPNRVNEFAILLLCKKSDVNSTHRQIINRLIPELENNGNNCETKSAILRLTGRIISQLDSTTHTHVINDLKRALNEFKIDTTLDSELAVIRNNLNKS